MHSPLSGMSTTRRDPRRAAVFAASLYVVACNSTDPDIADTLRFQISVDVSPSEIVLGDTANVTVTASNPTRDTLTFMSNECTSFYDVQDSLGTARFSYPRACNDIGLTHRVGPGESWVDTLPFDGRGPGDVHPRDTLSPGSYIIRGRIYGGPWSAPVSVRFRGPAP